MRATDDRPQARRSGLVVKVVGDEVQIYDLERHRAHRLNQAAAAVWRRLDGRASIAELAGHLREHLGAPADESTVWMALKELDRAHLLLTTAATEIRPGLSRRELMRRLSTGAAAAVPVVSSLIAPRAADAASCLPFGAPCTSFEQCCSKCCGVTSCC